MDIFLLHADKPFSKYEHLLQYALEERVHKINSLKSDCDKKLSLLSHLFARHKIALDLNIPFDEVKFSFNEYGKPYIKKDNYHFSISHSGTFVAFVSHTSPVGVDVQEMKSVISPAVRFFTQNEKDYINSDPHRFFEIWTKKEAYIKMLGTGLSTPLSSFDVLTEPVKSMVLGAVADGFFISVCGKNISEINIHSECV